MIKCQLKIFNKICFKYHIILIRNKISFTAFQKCKTIVELFLSQIIETYEAIQLESDISQNSACNNYDKRY